MKSPRTRTRTMTNSPRNPSPAVRATATMRMDRVHSPKVRFQCRSPPAARSTRLPMAQHPPHQPAQPQEPQRTRQPTSQQHQDDADRRAGDELRVHASPDLCQHQAGETVPQDVGQVEQERRRLPTAVPGRTDQQRHLDRRQRARQRAAVIPSALLPVPGVKPIRIRLHLRRRMRNGIRARNGGGIRSVIGVFRAPISDNRFFRARGFRVYSVHRCAPYGFGWEWA